MRLDLDEEARLTAASRLVGRPGREALEAALAGLTDRSWRVRKAAIEAILAHPDRDAALDGLIAALRDEADAGLRNSAAEALVRLGAAAVPVLLGRMTDADPEVRKFVVDVLGEIADRQTVSALAGALRDSDMNVRTAAAEALGKIGDERAVTGLLTVIDGDDLWLRHAALSALGRIRRPLPRPLLERLVAHPQLRRAAYDLIGQVRDAAAADLVLAGVADRGRSTREAAIAAVWDLWRTHPALGAPLAEALRSRGQEPEWRETVSRSLGSPSDDTRLAAGALLAIAGDPAGIAALVAAAADDRLRAPALAALRAAGATSSRELETMLGRDPDESRRELAAALLGELAGGEEEWAALRAALRDPSPAVRAAAALALGRGETAAAADWLTPLLIDPVEEVKAAVVTALARLAAATRPDLLLDRARPLLASHDAARRRTAVLLLGRVGDLGDPGSEAAREAAGRLTFALKDADAAVRRDAVTGLGRLGRADGVEPLLLALADEATDVRIEAASALGRLRHRTAAPALALLVRDPDPWVRAAALEALGAVGEASTFPAIAAALKAEEPLVVLAAIDAAAAIDGGAAVPLLLPLLGAAEPDVVKAAARVLGTLGGAPVTAALVPLLAAADWGVRAAAAEALGRRRDGEARPALQARLALEDDDVACEAIRLALEALG